MPLNLHFDICEIHIFEPTNVEPDVDVRLNDVRLNCKSCNNLSFISLPLKNDQVKKFLRKFITPNSKTCPETLKCKNCEKPSNFDLVWIQFFNNKDTCQYTSKCKSCKKTSQICIPYNNAHTQKILLKLCN